MASSPSASLRLELMATGDQSGTWGDTTNTNLGTLLEQAITGYLSVAQGDVANLTLTTTNYASDQARNAVIRVTGALTATRNVVIQTAAKLYTIANDTTGGFSIVVKTSAGTGVSVPPGAMMNIYSDGTNAVMGQNYWSGSIGGAVYLDAGAAVGPNYDLFRDSTSPAISDLLGRVTFNGRDSAGNKQEYASIQTTIIDPTSTSEDGSLDLYATVAGTRTLLASVYGTGLGLANGTVSLPSLSFISDPDSGLYRIGANNVGVAVNGAKVLDVSTAGLDVTGALSVASTAGTLATLTRNEDGASGGPTVVLMRNSASPAAADGLGEIYFNGKDTAGNDQTYGYIGGSITTATSTTEDGKLSFATTVAGTFAGRLNIGAGVFTQASDGDPGNGLIAATGYRFPATPVASSNVNTIDTYYEGDWTPTMTFNASSTGVTYSTQTGRVIKIGKQVTVWGRVVLTSNGSGVGTARLASLPFTTQAAVVLGVGGVHVTAGGASILGVYLVPDINATTAVFYIPGATSSTAATDTNITDTFTFGFSLTYEATS